MVPVRMQRRARGPRVAAVGTAVVAIAVSLVVATGCGSERSNDGRPPVAPGASSDATSPVATTTPPTTVDPGTLAQTRDKPPGSSPELETGARALWAAIVADDPSLAMPFFFPLSAYEQVKDISNPETDWHNRLVAAYERDVHALHKQLGASASVAEYVGIDVPVTRAQWIDPGGEYNKIGYWRVYGTKLNYTVGGRASSLPVYSLISWRGVWYAVHLGPIK